MEHLRSFVVCVILLPAIVTGIDFTFSKQKVLLDSEGTLTMTCDVTETDIESVYLFHIRRLRESTLSGSDPTNWTTLALIEPGKIDSPSLDPGITANTKDYVAGGSWDSNSSGDAVLTLAMNVQKLVCDDARYYRCELIYKSFTGDHKSMKRNGTFTAYVKPHVTSLIARKNGIIVQGSSPNDMAAVNVGDELELTCTAGIGSLSGTIIKWHRTSETASTNEFIDYQPPQGTYDEGRATSDNSCGYTRVAMIKYNTTIADASRYNNLAFECYVTVTGDPYGNSYTSENNPRFYADIIAASTTQKQMMTTGNGGSVVDILYSSLLVTFLIALNAF